MVASSNPPEAAKPSSTPPPDQPAAAENPVTTEASSQPVEEPTPANDHAETDASKPAESTAETTAFPDLTEQSACALPTDKDDVNPTDFGGEVETNNDLPSIETLRKIENYVVLDSHGKTHTFKSLYSGRSVARRVLIIFVRHFFCGNCQEYLRSLSASITPDALLGLPISTFIAVVGCGDPGLIDMYASATGCPFPIYADPTRKLYSELGMIKTLALGARPAYMKKSLLKSSIESIVQGLKKIGSGLVTKAGDQRQIGGEFLFEPLSILSPEPIPPAREHEKQLGDGGVNGATVGETEAAQQKATSHHEDEEEGPVEEKKVTWCHRMRTTRDHAEIPEIMEVLGLDGQGEPIKDVKRWSKALQTRKGTGLSMASQMSQLSQMKASTGRNSDEVSPVS